MINIKTIKISPDDVIIIQTSSEAEISISTVPGNSALPVVRGEALMISGVIDDQPTGYSAGNSGYSFRKYRNDAVYVQPGIVIPHESQLPRCYILAAGAMFWRTLPITHTNKTYETEEIVFNKEVGEITFPKINEEVIRLWQTVSLPLLKKQLKEIEISERR